VVERDILNWVATGPNIKGRRTSRNLRQSFLDRCWTFSNRAEMQSFRLGLVLSLIAGGFWWQRAHISSWEEQSVKEKDGTSLLARSANGSCIIRRAGDRLWLENAQVRLGLDLPSHGSIVAIADPQTGAEFLSAPGGWPLLYSLTVRGADGKLSTLHNRQAEETAIRAVRSGAGVQLTLTNRHPGAAGGTIRCRFQLGEGSPTIRATVDLSGFSTGLDSIRFPVISGIGALGENGEDDYLLTPHLEGILIRNPALSITPERGQFLDYGGSMTLQIMALYDSAAGLAVWCDDARGFPKSFHLLRGRPSEPLSWSVLHRFPAEPGRRRLPYGIRMTVFHGDWQQAAEVYRDWATQQSFCPAPLSERTDISPWLLQAPLFLWVGDVRAQERRFSLEQVPTAARAFSRSFGSPIGVVIFGWENAGSWVGPFYFPPWGGGEAFSAVARALRADGNRLLPFISGNVWRLRRKDLGYDGSTRFEKEGIGEAARRPDGSLLYAEWYFNIGWDAAFMCTGSAEWRKRVINNTEQLARLGAGLVQVDEFPTTSGYPCYATDHGHPPGYGAWMQDSGLRMLESARRKARVIDPELALSTEDPQEHYLRAIDMYDSRDSSGETLKWYLVEPYEGNACTVPLFTFVYHDRTIAYTFVIGSSDELYEAYCLARALVWGKLVGRKTDFPEPTSLGQANRDYLQRILQTVRGYGYSFLVLGRMLAVRQLEGVPEISIDYSHVGWDAAKRGEKPRTRTLRVPGIFATKWESPSGDRGWVLTSLLEKPHRVELALDPDRPFFYLVRSGRVVLSPRKRPKHNLTFNIAPREVVLLGMSSQPALPPRAPQSRSNARPCKREKRRQSK